MLQALHYACHTRPLLVLPQPLLRAGGVLDIAHQCAGAELGALSLTCKATKRTLYIERRRQAGTLGMVLSACRKLLLVPVLPMAAEVAPQAGPAQAGLDQADPAAPARQGTLRLICNTEEDCTSVVLKVARGTVQQQAAEQQSRRLLACTRQLDVVGNYMAHANGLAATTTVNSCQAAVLLSQDAVCRLKQFQISC